MALHAVVVPEQTVIPLRWHTPWPEVQGEPVTRQNPPHGDCPAGQRPPQAPPTQDAVPPTGAGQTLPHVPQWLTAERRSTSQPLAGFRSQSSKPVRQVKPQTDALHRGAVFGGEGHAFPHRPQFERSDRVSTQPPPHGVWPAGHEETQVPFEHRHPLAQGLLQRPQCTESLLRFRSQPLVATPSQLSKPGLQIMPHRPAPHVGEAFARGAQALPQAPQFVRSVRRSTQVEPQGVVPAAQESTHAPRSHRSPDRQRAPQVEQLALSLARALSQPLTGLPSQLPKPARQFTTQEEEAQAGVEFARDGQTLSQRPQFSRSASRVVQAPPHRT